MAVGLARVTGGISSSCDRDEGKAVLAGYVACPRVRTHDATVVPVMHEECRYLDLAEVEARQVYLEAAWLEGNPPNARSSALCGALHKADYVDRSIMWSFASNRLLPWPAAAGAIFCLHIITES